MGSNPERRQPAHGNAVRDAFKNDLVGLADAADHVRALLAHPGWDHVCRLLDVQQDDVDRKLDGSPLEHVEYAHFHGLRRGLTAAPGIAHAIVSYADEQIEKQRVKHERTADAVLGAT